MIEREEMIEIIHRMIDKASYKQVRRIYYLMLGMRMAQEEEEYRTNKKGRKNGYGRISRL